MLAVCLSECRNAMGNHKDNAEVLEYPFQSEMVGSVPNDAFASPGLCNVPFSLSAGRHLNLETKFKLRARIDFDRESVLPAWQLT